MKGTILEKMIQTTWKRIHAIKSEGSGEGIEELASIARFIAEPHRFCAAIEDGSRVNIIAEFKRASPSRGIINGSATPEDIARQYCEGGAACISVLTEEKHFAGSLDDLRAVKNAVPLPLLRKDFVIDESQIHESAAAGADAVLLIAAAIMPKTLAALLELTLHYGMDAIVEVHDRDEMEIAAAVGATLIGVNNRDLRTFEVSLDVSRELIKYAPPDAVLIAESGIRSAEDIRELSELGYSAFLIGEALMTSGNIVSELKRLATENINHPV